MTIVSASVSIHLSTKYLLWSSPPLRVLMSGQLITDFGINGGDERQTGYYAGLIVSLVVIAITSRSSSHAEISLVSSTLQKL